VTLLKPTLILAAALLAATAATAQTAAATGASGIDRSAIDGAVRPQDDLYAHVNGRWLRATPFPPDKASVGVGEQLHDLTQRQLRSLVEEAQRRPNDPDAARIGDLYASFMDEAAIDRLGLKPLKAELAAIDAVADRAQFAALMPRLGRIGVEMPIGLGIVQDDRDATRYVPALSQDGLGLPNRDYYLSADDPKFAAVRARYLVYLGKLLTLSGADDSGESGPEAILALETVLARAQWSAVENRDPVKAYNRVALEALPALASGIDWPGWLGGAALIGKTPDVLVRQPSYLKGLAAALQATPLATWKAYARVRLLDAYAKFLPTEFVAAHFAFAGTALRGTLANRPRWQRGVALVDQSVGESLGKLYVARHFSAESQRRMDALVTNLLATYRESIAGLDWMTPATRDAALAKLARFNVKIGHPKRWIDYRELQIRRGDLVGNVMRARAFEESRQIAKLGKPIDRDEWGMTPQTINAYYDPSLNEIVFPAAFLQPPLFDAGADDAANYGAIGAVIGHEISHGFDDQGSQYDGEGNLRDWWSETDRANFAAKTKALVAQYAGFVAVPPDYRVDGELTLGENIADNAGLAVAWKAYQRALDGKAPPLIDGMSGAERFFYGYAQAWRGKVRPDALLAQIKSDPHSPNEFRVLGAVRNLGAFYGAFNVRAGDKMYLAPTDRVSIW
jgi:putative endopeptidase